MMLPPSYRWVIIASWWFCRAIVAVQLGVGATRRAWVLCHHSLQYCRSVAGPARRYINRAFFRISASLFRGVTSLLARVDSTPPTAGLSYSFANRPAPSSPLTTTSGTLG